LVAKGRLWDTQLGITKLPLFALNNSDNCYFITIVILDLGATVPELLFEKKGLTPAVEQLLTSYPIEVSFDRTENGRL